MKALITGSNGFIGKNIKLYLKSKNIYFYEFNRKDSYKKLQKYIENSDVIFHLAGENRSNNKKNFEENNFKLTRILVEKIISSKKKPSIIFSSTIKINEKNNYGITKKKCEKIIIDKLKKSNINYSILRLPNIFGKWAKPDHNSFIATCCYNILRGKKITLHNNKELKLIYIDDLIAILFNEAQNCLNKKKYFKLISLKKFYTIKLRKLYLLIKYFNEKFKSINNDLTNTPFKKKLFSTFISYLPSKKFKFSVIKNEDKRGSFVEFSKTKNSGQISFFTIKPGVTRGGHYHNTKIEKFLLLSGSLNYITKNLSDNKKKTFKLNSNKAEVIYSIPGHIHFFKNNTNKEALVLIWANEMFSLNKPDTFII